MLSIPDQERVEPGTARTRTRPQKAHRAVAFALLAGLLFLRFGVATGVVVLRQVNVIDINRAHAVAVFEVGTYLLTACLIWWERERLVEFHIDTLALAMIILFKPVEALIGTAPPALSFPRPLSWTYFAIAAGLVVMLRRSRTQFSNIRVENLRWLGVAVVVGVVTAAGYTALAELPDLTSGLSLHAGDVELRPVITRFFQQIGYAAVTEEPLFRGFLWGYLRNAGWRHSRILLFQALLFAVAHAYYLFERPILVVGVFLAAIVLGLLAWRSRSIATSMVGHTTVNTFGELFMRFVLK